MYYKSAVLYSAQTSPQLFSHSQAQTAPWNMFSVNMSGRESMGISQIHQGLCSTCSFVVHTQGQCFYLCFYCGCIPLLYWCYVLFSVFTIFSVVLQLKLCTDLFVAVSTLRNNTPHILHQIISVVQQLRAQSLGNKKLFLHQNISNEWFIILCYVGDYKDQEEIPLRWIYSPDCKPINHQSTPYPLVVVVSDSISLSYLTL